MKKLFILCAAALFAGSAANAQNFRPQSKDGINVFEYKAPDTTKFDGVKVKIGGAFTQSWQALKHSNTALDNSKAAVAPSLGNNYQGTAAVANTNALYAMKPGFNLAVANLNFDVALADGVDLKMEMYLSSRHHQETWVKGGYIQFNKLPFLKCDLTDNIMKNTTIKVGHMEINYGDQHFRRTDNGNALYNPFIENYIMDAFATEIGAEIDYSRNGFIGVLGMTTGQIKGDISAPSGATDSTSTGDRRPAFLGKLGWDGKLLNDRLRVRATGSFYYTAGSGGVTLYGGDRGGSGYFGVIENANTTSTAFSGRFNPSTGDQITSYMGNLLLTYKLTDLLSLESFSTYEVSSGKAKTAVRETKSNQLATELIVRYGNFFVGGRYNTVDCDFPLAYTATKAKINPYSVSIDRTAFSGGWFITKNIMAKAEYVTQKYDGFLPSDIRNGAKFDGLTVQAVIAF